MQEAGTDEELAAVKRDRRHRAVRAAWRQRHAALAAAAVDLDDSAAAARASQQQGLQCIPAMWPSSVLGSVSEQYADKVAAVLGSADWQGSAEEQAYAHDVLNLRYGAPCSSSMHQCAERNLARSELALCSGMLQLCSSQWLCCWHCAAAAPPSTQQDCKTPAKITSNGTNPLPTAGTCGASSRLARQSA